MFVVIVLQYVPANAGVPGAYMPQYAAMQPVPVSLTQYPIMHWAFPHIQAFIIPASKLTDLPT